MTPEDQKQLIARVDNNLRALKTSLNLVGLSDITEHDPEYSDWCNRLEKSLRKF